MATALASAGILLAGWQSGAHIADTGTATTTSLGSSASAAGGTTTGTSGSSSATSSGTKTTTTAATYDGTAVQTRFGPSCGHSFKRPVSLETPLM